MYIVRPNLYGALNENMQQAKAILRKAGVPETDKNWQVLKKMLVDDNRVGYIGKFTKWLIQEHDALQKIIDTYELLKSYPGTVPPIDTFNTAEDLYDFLGDSKAESKLNQIINSAPSKTRENIDKKIKDLLEANLKHADELMDFFSKAGGRYNKYSKKYSLPSQFKTYSDWLYNILAELIKNLNGSYNLEAMLKKIKNAPGNANIVLARPDLLIIEPLDFKMSCAVGSERLCISNSESMWNSYVNIFNVQYFAYDFTKDFQDKRSMVASTINPDGTIREVQFRTNDGTARRDFNKGDPVQGEMAEYFKPRDPQEIAAEVNRRIKLFKSAEMVQDGGFYEVWLIGSGSDARTIVSRLGGRDDDFYLNFYLIIDTSVQGHRQILGIKVEPEGGKKIIDAGGQEVPESYLDKF